MALTQLSNKLIYLPWIIGFGLLIENIDIFVINTAIPQMAITLATQPITLKIAVTSYLLTLAAFIPVSGYIADKFGTKTTIASAMLIFLIGSAISGFAHHIIELVGGRLIQGIGGAMMAPVGRLILLRAFPREHFIRAFSSLTILGQIGAIIGPVVGGVVTHFLSWRFVFFINIPLGIFALILIYLLIDNTKSVAVEKFDFYGFALFGIGAGLVVFSLSLLAEQAPSLVTELIMLGIGVILLILFAQHSYKTLHASLDLRLFNIRTFRIAVIGGFIFRIGMGGIPFLLPLLLQIGLKQNALQSGLWLLPYGIATLSAKPLVQKLLRKYGFRKLLILSPVIITILLFVLAAIVYQYSPLRLLITLMLIGFFGSLQYTCINVLNFADISVAESAKATSITSVFQQIALSFGVCAVAFLLILFNHATGTTLISLRAFHNALISLSFILLSTVLLFRQLQLCDGSRLL